MNKFFLPIGFFSLFLFQSHALADNMDFSINPEQVIGPISPYIYGANVGDTEGTGVTVKRLGGNRLTAYNWENNASNAGTDWRNSSDDWLSADHLKFGKGDGVGSVITRFVDKNRKEKAESMLTLQMAGYVAADKLGNVKEDESAPSKRWKEVLFSKNAPFSTSPDSSDNAVYMDEFVRFLVNKYGTADKGGVRFYCLDNEPALWPSTHPLIHPRKTGYFELAKKTEECATAVLKVDPSATLLGPVLYGWLAYQNLQEAPESKEINQKFGSFVGFYLDQMKSLESKHGKRLVHVLDLHWYPEAMGGGKRITENDASEKSVEARLQAPRSLWDPSYVEDSWITKDFTNGRPIRLIPWIMENIGKYYPGTKMGFSEYDYGAGDHVSGGIAQADVLGIFGREGVFSANYFEQMKPYNKAAFKIYRNYDGKGAAFGDTEVSAQTPDITKTSIYASLDSKKPGILRVMILNKSQKESISGKFKIQGKTDYKTFESYGFNSESPEIKSLKKGTIDKNQFEYLLSPLTATLFVCR